MDQEHGAERAPTRKTEIASGVRVLIYDGTYPVGAKLPTVRELMDEHGIANGTAQEVLGQLREWGLAEPRGPLGTYVPEPRGVVHPRARLSRMAAGFSPLSPGESSRITDAGWCEQVPVRVREALSVHGQRVARREGIVLRGDSVVELTLVWHTERAADAAPELREPQPISQGGTVGALARAGIRIQPSASAYAITAHAADEQEAALLGCRAGDALLTISNTRLEEDGTPVEHLEMCYPPGVELLEPRSA